MLTRRRFGITENSENIIPYNKDLKAHVKPVDEGIVTRSRSALGEIRNNADNFSKDHTFKRPLTKSLQTKKPLTENDMSLDLTEQNTLSPEQVSYFKYMYARFIIRRQLLSREDNEFLCLESIDFHDEATICMFSQSIYNYLQNRELSLQPLLSNFMSNCTDITPRMRYILVNWLVQVHQSYKMQPETLYLAVALMDRYMQVSGSTISKDKFQLIGITALFVASKFEEMFPPEISDFSSVTENAYSKKEIRQCEQLMLQNVDFFLSIPLPIMFLRRLSRALDADRQMHNIAKYLLELTIQEYELCYLPGNLRAAVAVCLARALQLHTYDLSQAWHDCIGFLSGYTQEDIAEPIRILAKAAYRQNSPSKFRAIFDKYRLDDFYDRVAALPQLRSYIMENIACLKFDDEDTEAKGIPTQYNNVV